MQHKGTHSTNDLRNMNSNISPNLRIIPRN